MVSAPPFQRVEMSSGAVLLSYASPDARAAMKIGEALRSAGADVWVDESGEGGSTGDAEVRQRIKDCLLFVPIISEHTQEGREGSFRREWALADRRAHTLEKGRPFLVPVSIDATDDRSALVPESFLEVPWTRLPGGETPPAFCEQVRRLLADTGPLPGDTGTVEAAPRIPDYELLRLIGRGSYGDVWLARGLTGIYRAIKVVWRDRFRDAAPFEREFRGLKEFAAISLGESVQLALLHIGRNEAAGLFYYVMELADDVERGRDIDPAHYVPLTLKELRGRRGRLPAEECVGIGVELARVVAGLHARGLVHRDIKPSNVILVGGVPKLADVGLVTAASDARTFVGTDGFVPPEGPGSPRADVFAVGRLLYEITTGLDRQQFPQLPPGLDRLPDHRALLKLNEVILRACDPRPEQRYPDGQALLADLLRLQAGRPVRRSAPRRRVAVVAMAASLALAAVWVWLRPSAAPMAGRVTPAPAVSEKSLVVLPLDNLSPDPANAFFTDGMHAEIIAALGRVPDLRVISRNSALSLDQKASLTEIGRQLGVAYVITGSVRRAESRVRIQLELRRASDETVLWTQSYDRELRDAMAVQNEIADDVARVLQARTAKGMSASAEFMTKDPRAYDLYLKARDELFNQLADDQIKLLQKVIIALEEALRLDPEFASAANLLSIAHAQACLWMSTPTEWTAHAAAARQWAEKASELMPGGAGDGALAYYYVMVDHDYSRALHFAGKYLQARPNEEAAHNIMGLVLFGMGRAADAAAELRRALAVDPRNLQVRSNELVVLANLRRRAAWEAALTEYRSIAPAGEENRYTVAASRFVLTGEVPAAPREIFGKHAMSLFDWLWLGRHFAEALAEIDTRLGSPGLTDDDRFWLWLGRSKVLRRLDRAREADEAARAALALAGQPQGGDEYDRTGKDGRLAWALAEVGRSDEAIAAGRRYVEGRRASDQQGDRWVRETVMARLYATCHRPRECVALLAQLLRVPSGLTVPMLRVSPDWDPVRDDPGFQALLKDSRNSEPL